jgi:hypothetical protein
LSGAGLLRAGGRQRIDSTHVLAAVRTLNRMEFAGETLRAALEALAAAAPGWLSALTGAGWADRYGARTGSCRFSKGEDARGRWLGQVGRDVFTLLDAVTAPGALEWPGQVPTVETLRRAWDQQYRRDGQEVRWREGRTSRQVNSGSPPLTTPMAATGSSAGPGGPVTRST